MRHGRRSSVTVKRQDAGRASGCLTVACSQRRGRGCDNLYLKVEVCWDCNEENFWAQRLGFLGGSAVRRRAERESRSARSTATRYFRLHRALSQGIGSSGRGNQCRPAAQRQEDGRFISRYDGGKPRRRANAANELVSSCERPHCCPALSCPHLVAVSDFRQSKKVFFLADEPVTNRHHLRPSNRYTFRLRLQYMQAAMW